MGADTQGSSNGEPPTLADGNFGPAATSTATGGEPPLPPEVELESTFETPVITGRFVWSTNPESGRVALIDAVSLDVQTVEAGLEPRYITALAGTADAGTALVLNVGSRDATVLEAAAGEISSYSVSTHAGANAWAVSDDARWAIAWTDAGKVEGAPVSDGFQDVTVIPTGAAGGDAVRLSVGYRPVSIGFDVVTARAFVVTEPGISVIDLGLVPAEITDLYELGDANTVGDAVRDVSVAPDGTFALVRHEGSPRLGIVDLADGTRVEYELAGAITDLDLSEDGTRAVAVIRARAEAVILSLPDALTDPASLTTVSIPGELVGSVALPPAGDLALLYTTAVPSDRLTVLTLDAEPPGLRTVSVKTAVQAVFVGADSEHAIAFQAPGASGGKQGAFSVIPTRTERAPKIVATDAPPMAVALADSADGQRALVTVRDDVAQRYGVYLVRMPSLQVDFIELASPPLATGAVPEANRAFVAQEHPEGRITFVDLSDGSARTLTGFELGSKVVD